MYFVFNLILPFIKIREGKKKISVLIFRHIGPAQLEGSAPCPQSSSWYLPPGALARAWVLGWAMQKASKCQTIFHLHRLDWKSIDLIIKNSPDIQHVPIFSSYCRIWKR